MAELTRCSHCGNDQEYYVKTQVRGTYRHEYRFDGADLYNGEIHDYLLETPGKYAYCAECNKRLFKIEG